MSVRGLFARAQRLPTLSLSLSGSLNFKIQIEWVYTGIGYDKEAGHNICQVHGDIHAYQSVFGVDLRVENECASSVMNAL